MPLLGWTTVVQKGQKYKVVWENLEHLINMSYSAGFYDMVSVTVYIIYLQHDIIQSNII